VKAVRESLMLSAAELGSLMHVSRQAVAAMEASERAGTVRMSTLSAAAEALDCRLVWALVPRTTLEATVQTEAARIVDALAASVAHTMALEGQSVELSAASRSDHVDDVIRAGQIWSAR
jgi:predicted DNA-binding mobile mystery protein A